jgi:hypothetical protein
MLLMSLPPQMAFTLVPLKSGIKKKIQRRSDLTDMMFIPSYLVKNSLGLDRHRDILLSRHFLCTVMNTG